MMERHTDIIDKADVREFKLIDGSSVIAEILAEDGQSVLMYDPMQIIIEHSTALFVPWFTTMEDRYVQVDKSKTVANAGCNMVTKTMYFQALVRRQTYKLMEENPDNLEFYEELDADTYH